MELHSKVGTAQRTVIHDAIMSLARYGEANGRIMQVAKLPLTFMVIMEEVRSLYRVTSLIKMPHVKEFSTTLSRMRQRLSPPMDPTPLEAHILVQGFRKKYPDLCAQYVKSGTDTGRMTSDNMQTKPQKYDVPVDANGMYYPKPNGGLRILPSIYNQLRKWWMRANGVCQEPQEMHDGHLDNVLALLRESHGNAISRSTELLGKMANHFRNQPDIVAKLESLCLEMQKVDVDDMYPVFTLLAKERSIRQTIPIVCGVNLEWLNDGSLEWDDK